MVNIDILSARGKKADSGAIILLKQDAKMEVKLCTKCNKKAQRKGHVWCADCFKAYFNERGTAPAMISKEARVGVFNDRFRQLDRELAAFGPQRALAMLETLMVGVHNNDFFGQALHDPVSRIEQYRDFLKGIIDRKQARDDDTLAIVTWIKGQPLQFDLSTGAWISRAGDILCL